MATDLTGLKVKDTYNSLLKIGDNSSLSATPDRISDGLGNESALWLSTARVGIGSTPDSNYTLTVSNNIKTQSLDASSSITASSLRLTGGSGTQGLMSWNTDEETIDITQNGAVLQVGQETQVHVKNQTGSTIADGTPVYVTGTLGSSGRLTVAPMIANGTIEAKYFLGITTEDIPNGEDGKVTTFGKIRGLDTSSYSEGQTLYVSSSTAGAFQTTAPVAPNLDLEVAIVINVSTNQGTIFVRAQNGYYLGLLHDVYLSSPANNQFLVYNSTNSRWENSNDLVVNGNLTVSGTTTFIDTINLNIGDAIITLNADIDGVTAPTEDAGIEVKRGSSSNVSFLWDETNDRWTLGTEDLVAANFIGNLTGNISGNADTVDNKHATDFTLDYVTDNGATTTNNITVGDITATGATFQESGTGGSTTVSIRHAGTTGSGILDLQSATAPSIIQSDTDLQFKTSGSARLHIEDTGNVGINITSPTSGDFSTTAPKLHIKGSDTSGSYHPVARFQAGNDSNDTGAAILINHSNDRGLAIRAGRKDSDRPVAFFDLIDSNGSTTNMITLGEYGSDFRAGIGTTSPTDKFQIDAPNSQLRLRDTDDGTFTQFSSSGNLLAIRQNSTTASHFWMNSSGNVGLGTNSPNEKLVVSGDVKINTNGDAGVLHFGDTSDQTKIIGYDSSDKIDFYTNGSFRATIDNTGLGIGITSPFSKLSIDSNGAPSTSGNVSSSGLTIHNGTGGTAIQIGTYDAGGYSYIQSTYVNSANVTRGLQFLIGNSAAIAINTSRNVGIGTTSPSYKLDVSGNARVTAGLFLDRVTGQPNIKGTGEGHIVIDSVNASHAVFLQNYVSGNVYLATGGGNVGIGTTSPGEKLHVNGTIKLGGYSYIGEDLLDADSLAIISDHTESITFGQYNPSTSTHSETMRINSSGNVLISDTTYAGFGQLQIGNTSTTTTRLQMISSSTVGSGGIHFGDTTSATNGRFAGFLLYDHNGDYMRLGTDETERMRITSAGNVGIGTSSPSGKLTVDIDSSGTVLDLKRDDGVNGRLYLTFGAAQSNFYSSGLYTFNVAGSEKMRLNSTGLGIGTTSPAEKLSVNGAIRSTGATTSNESSATIAWNNTPNESSFESRGKDNTARGKIVLYQAYANGTNGLRVLETDSSGNVGIGTSPAHKLDVSGAIHTTSDIHLDRSSFITMYGNNNAYHGIGSRNASGTADDDIRINSYGAVYINLDSNNNNSSNADFKIGRHGAATGTISSWLLKVDGETGALTCANDIIAFGSPSDISLKENIKPIEGALDKVKKLQGVTFDWKQNDDDILKIKEDYGFIAQEVQEVLPELVRENENGKLSLRDKGIISVLVEAIKEQQKQIEQQQLQIDELKAIINA